MQQVLGLRAEHVGGLLLADTARSASSPSSDLAELDVVLLAHPVEPVEALGLVRRDGWRGWPRDEPLVAERGARERMRPAARDAPGREALEPERVGDRVDVGDAVGDAPARPRVEPP